MRSPDLLIDRYVAETVRLVPHRARSEAEESLRTKIRVAMAGRFDRPLEEVAVKDRYRAAQEVLRELGPPEAAATALRPGRDWLIAPHLMPRFLATAAICLGGLLAVKVLGAMGRSAMGEPFGWVEMLLRLVASLDDLVLEGLVVLVVLVGVFLVLERTLEAEAAVRRRWDPRELLRTDPERLSRFGRTVGMVMAAAAFVALNVFPQALGAHVTMGDESVWVPLVSPGVAAQIAWVDLWLVGVVALDLVLLWRGRWSALTHTAEAALSLLFGFLAWRLHLGAPLLAVDGAWMAERGWSAEAIARYRDLVDGKLVALVQEGLRWVALFAVFVAVIELVKAARAALRHLG